MFRTISFHATLLALSIGLVSAARAQQPSINFQASTFHQGDTTWKDQVKGVVATVSGTPTAKGGSISTDNGSFVFNTDDAKLTGLKSYTLAIGFTATKITVPGNQFYGANGLLGGDIPGAGQGDVGIGLTTDGEGQIVAGLGTLNGSQSGEDRALYHTNVTTGGGFSLNQPFGVVLVVDNSGAGGAGKVSLYVNGFLTTQEGTITDLTLPLLGSKDGAVGNFQFGIGAVANGYGGTLQGSVTQVKIYDTALTTSQATALSTSIAKPSISEHAAH